jgi:hypothetical protein
MLLDARQFGLSSALPLIRVRAMSTSSDEELEIRFQEAHGAHLFREGKPRAVLEVKRPQISTAIYKAR